MTNEEIKQAISILRIQKPVRGARCRMYAYDNAIEALEKQIPQQVNLEGDGYDSDGNLVYDMAYCPNPDCGQEFEEADENWECNYCPCCGQALDWWGDEEGESTN